MIAIIFLILIFPGISFAEDNWEEYASTSYGISYYNCEQIFYSSDYVIKAWTKTKLNEKGKEKVISINPDMMHVDYLLRLSEVDCNKRKSRSLAIVGYSSRNKPLTDAKSAIGNWENLVPDSDAYHLSEIVCDKFGREVCTKPK